MFVGCWVCLFVLFWGVKNKKKHYLTWYQRKIRLVSSQKLCWLFFFFFDRKNISSFFFNEEPLAITNVHMKWKGNRLWKAASVSTLQDAAWSGEWIYGLRTTLAMFLNYQGRKNIWGSVSVRSNWCKNSQLTKKEIWISCANS